jgi:hypothetical protein
MAKKCLTATGNGNENLTKLYIQGVFIQNEIHRDIFDLTPGTCSNLPFTYFRISLPIQPYLIQQGAVFVAESHKGAAKVLHSGLKHTKINSIYYGDVYDPLTRTKSLILFQLMPGANSYTVYLFVGYYPKSLNKVLNEML